MSGQRITEIQTPGGTFVIVGDLKRTGITWDAMKALFAQAKKSRMRLTAEHAAHIIDEWSVTPDFPAFP